MLNEDTLAMEKLAEEIRNLTKDLFIETREADRGEVVTETA